MVKLWLYFLMMTPCFAFYLKAGPGHNTEQAEILTDPIEGKYHIYLFDIRFEHICAIGCENDTILFTDSVCTEVSIQKGPHWLFRINHREHPYGTITVKILMADGSQSSEQIIGYCPGTHNSGQCLAWQANHTHSRTRRIQRGTSYPQIAVVVFFISLIALFYFR
jgi:hypothetical protein